MEKIMTKTEMKEMHGGGRLKLRKTARGWRVTRPGTSTGAGLQAVDNDANPQPRSGSGDLGLLASSAEHDHW